MVGILTASVFLDLVVELDVELEMGAGVVVFLGTLGLVMEVFDAWLVVLLGVLGLVIDMWLVVVLETGFVVLLGLVMEMFDAGFVVVGKDVVVLRWVVVVLFGAEEVVVLLGGFEVAVVAFWVVVVFAGLVVRVVVGRGVVLV